MDFEGICRSAVAGVLGHPPEKVTADLEIDDIDSLDWVEIAVSIEEDTGLDLLDLEQPATFGALVAAVRAKAGVAA